MVVAVDLHARMAEEEQRLIQAGDELRARIGVIDVTGRAVVDAARQRSALRRLQRHHSAVGPDCIPYCVRCAEDWPCPDYLDLASEYPGPSVSPDRGG